MHDGTCFRRFCPENNWEKIFTLIQEHGLGMVVAALFLSGEMAGSGVLALARAVVGTGHI